MIVSKNAKLGALISYIGWPLAALFGLDVAVAVAFVFGGWKWLALPDVPLSIFGGVIGVIAGFRNSSSYARWWEARIIWGSLVNNSRCFAREVLTFVGASQGRQESTPELHETRCRLILLQVAYVHALRNHLRGTSPWPDLAGLISEREMEFLQSQNNVPLAIHHEIALIVADCYQKGWIDEIRWSRLDQTLSILMDCQGASERIKNTPIPRLYDMFVRVFIDIYCVLLPLGMVASLKLWTPFGSTLVGFMFFALDKIGRDLESPFEDSPHDIALTSISRTIEINLRQMMGDKEVPEPLAPVNGVLW
jgi:ion channel-forming bestrophin family protein